MNADVAPRPTSLADYVGQEPIVAALRRAISAARRGDRPLGHVLVTGGPGLGKTSLAGAIAAELGAPIVAVNAPAIEHKGALAALLTSLRPGAVLFVDEIHALPRALQELLYPAMEDGYVDLPAGKQVVRVPLAPFTLVAATTRAALLSQPLRDRFAYSFQLRPHGEDAIAEIVHRAAAKIGLSIDPAAAREVARRSRSTPRVALRLLRACRDFAAAAGQGSIVTAACTVAALRAAGVDEAGLEALDRDYLAAVVRAGAPIGLDAVASAIGEEPRTIEEVVEPHLVALGLVQRTPRGRVATAAGVAHLQGRAQGWAPRSRQLPEADVEDAEVLS